MSWRLVQQLIGKQKKLSSVCEKNVLLRQNDRGLMYFEFEKNTCKP